MKLAALITPGAIVPSLAGGDRDAVIAELMDALVAADALPASMRDEAIQRVVERENHGSTGFGKGVAVPHVKLEGLEKIAATVGVSATGVDFKALDQEPVYTVVLLVSPTDRPDEHLRAMEAVFHQLQNETFRRVLRQAASAQDIMELLQEADGHQLQN